MKAKLLFRQKNVYSDGAIIESRVWLVPKGPRMPEGYKYSLVYIDHHGRRVLGYDNAEGKGHHRHEGKNEMKVYFRSIDGLIQRFLKEVQEKRRKRK